MLTNNSMIERTVRLIVEAARALLIAAGLGPNWWPFACMYFVTAWNITPQWFPSLLKMISPWEIRFGHRFPGQRPLFGQLVTFRPMQPTVKAMPKFETTGQQGVFLGWDLQPGSVWDNKRWRHSRRARHEKLRYTMWRR